MPGPDLPDLEERLRRLPAALAVEAPAGLAERVARGGRRRRRLRRAAAAVVAALVAGTVVTRAVVLDHTPTPVLDPGLLVRNATPTQLVGGRWRRLPEPPPELAHRLGPAVAWTGHELVVWGGVNRHDRDFSVQAGGAGYDPKTGRWVPLPLAPENQYQFDESGVTAWTGREVLVWGGVTFPDQVNAPNTGWPPDGVAYDPARRTWRKLPARPRQLTSLGDVDTRAVWTGRELLVTGVQEGAGGGMVGAAYDPAADRWRLLPPSPALTAGRRHLQARTAVWAGTRLLVWNFWGRRPRPASNESGARDRPEPGVEPDGIDLWAYEPATDRWTVLPAPPTAVRRAVVDGSIVWDGRELVMASPRVRLVAGKVRSSAVAGRYDPDRARWTPIAGLPSLGSGLLRLTWTGAAVVELSSGVVYDPPSNRWLPLPKPAKDATPPIPSAGPERALVRIANPLRAGRTQIYVLEPAKPEP
jgi:hypothetical protein